MQLVLRLTAFVWPSVVVYIAAFAAPPTITNVSLRGLSLSGSTTLTIDGTNLLPDPKIVLPFALTQKVAPGATATRLQVEVSAIADSSIRPAFICFALPTQTACRTPSRWVWIIFLKCPSRPKSTRCPLLSTATSWEARLCAQRFLARKGSALLSMSREGGWDRISNPFCGFTTAAARNSPGAHPSLASVATHGAN